MRDSNRNDLHPDLKPDFLLNVEFLNEMPEFKCEMLRFPFPYNFDEIVKCKLPKFVKDRKISFELAENKNLDVDFFDISKYDRSKSKALTADDLKLMTDTSLDSINKKKSDKVISWLRKTEYISRSDYLNNSSSTSTTNINSYLEDSTFDGDSLFKPDEKLSKEEKLQIIEKTFKDAKLPINKKRFNKPASVVSTEVIELFPLEKSTDEQFKLSQVEFYTHPLIAGTQEPASKESMLNALLRKYNDEYGQYFAYYLPDEVEDILSKDNDKILDIIDDLTDDSESKSNILKLNREYNPVDISKTVKNREEYYLLNIDSTESATLFPINSRTKLNKRVIVDKNILDDPNYKIKVDFIENTDKTNLL